MRWRSKALIGVALVLSASAGWALRPDVVETITDTVIVELPPTELLDRIDELQIENEGIRARLEGRELRAPSVIYKTDTVVGSPDTVFAALRIDAGGVATIAPLILGSDSIPGYRPEIWTGIDLSDCDDGLSVTGGTIVCDKARLGHLEAFLRLTGGHPLLPGTSDIFQASTGLLWTPSFRSTWAVEVAIDITGRVYLGLQKSVRIF